MAITSVARKATVKPDNTLLKTMQLVGQQKAVAGKLKLEAQKQQSARAKQERDVFQNQVKRMGEIDSPTADAFAKVHNNQMQELNSMIIDPSVPTVEKEKAINDSLLYAKSAETFTKNVAGLKADFTGSEELRKLHSQDGFSEIAADYFLDENGDAKDLTEMNINEFKEFAENDIRLYNLKGSKEAYLETIEDQVSETTSANNMQGGLLTQVQNTKTSGDFLKLNEDGTILYNEETGQPTLIISGEQVAAYKKNKGHQLELAAIKAEEGNENMTDADAVELALKRDGFLTEKRAVETKVIATPKESESDKKIRQRLVDVTGRVQFFADDLIQDGSTGNETLQILKGGRAVVDSGTFTPTGEETPQTFETKVEETSNGKKFTIVVDPKRLQNVNFLTTPIAIGEGEDAKEYEYPLLSGKESKFQVTEIEIDKDNPREGLIRLNALYNQTVDAKHRIDHVEFMKAYEKWQEGKPSNVDFGFGGGESEEEIDFGF